MRAAESSSGAGKANTVTAVKLGPAARQANTVNLIKRMRTAHFATMEYNGGLFFKRTMELQRKNGALDTYALCEGEGAASSGEFYQKVDAGIAAELYDSRYAQEELRECLADVIRLRLLRKIRLAGAFSVLGDEATDVTTRAQLIIMVRFVNHEPDTAGYGKPMTAVLETVPLPRGNAAVIADAYVAARTDGASRCTSCSSRPRTGPPFFPALKPACTSGSGMSATFALWTASGVGAIAFRWL